MTPSDKEWLRVELYDSVTRPIRWRPVHLDRIEIMLEQWVQKEVERRLADIERERHTTDGC